MKPIWKFRLFAVLMMIVGGFAFSNLAAQLLRPASSPLPSRIAAASSQDQPSSAAKVSAIAPFRSDLKADYAIALAGQALKSETADQEEANAAAQDAVKNALKLSPHDSRMWLILAMLQAQKNPGDQQISESLKMSYLTGPNRAELIPVRLETVTLHESLYDGDLRELARGDVRIVLTQLPEQRPELVKDYLRASSVGKSFLEESALTFDPNFADSLRGAK